jgi:hypothetical protein
LKAPSRASNPPCIASTRPFCGSSTTIPPETSGISRIANDPAPAGATAITSPGRAWSDTEISAPLEPSTKPILPLVPFFSITMPTRQSR